MPYPIDLISIHMEDVYVIVGMDWLSMFGVVIDYERQLVVVRAPSRGELTIYGMGTRIDSTFCLTARDMQCLHNGCSCWI